MGSETVAFLVKFGGLAGVVTLCVMALNVFFKWTEGKSAATVRMTDAGLDTLFKPEAQYSLVLASGQRFEGLRFVALSRVKDSDLAYDVRTLSLWRRPDGRDLLVRMDAVRAIEEMSQS